MKLVIREALNEIEKALKEGERVSLQGFGSWFIRETPEKKVRNPQTGEYFTQGPKKYLKWATAIKLKEAINDGCLRKN